MYTRPIVSYLAYKMNKSMIRKLALIFTFSSIITYFILIGLLGEEGYLHATAMRLELEALRQRQEVLLLQVDSLEQQKELMSSQDALKDAAFRFGYQEEGEQVFYFTDDGEVDQVRQEQDSFSNLSRHPFSGFSKLLIALIALAFSSLFTLVWLLRAKRSANNR